MSPTAIWLINAETLYYTFYVLDNGLEKGGKGHLFLDYWSKNSVLVGSSFIFINSGSLFKLI